MHSTIHSNRSMLELHLYTNRTTHYITTLPLFMSPIYSFIVIVKREVIFKWRKKQWGRHYTILPTVHHVLERSVIL